MTARRVPAAIALTATTVAGALLLTACGGSSSSDGNGKGGSGRLNVVASFYPLEFLAAQIGGDHVKVTDLTPPGTEPHDLELTAKQVGTVHQAEAALYLKGLQPSMDRPSPSPVQSTWWTR